jgi:hypothetical protein
MQKKSGVSFVRLRFNLYYKRLLFETLFFGETPVILKFIISF